VLLAQIAGVDVSEIAKEEVFQGKVTGHYIQVPDNNDLTDCLVM